MKGTQGRPAHHFPVTALTSAFTVSDLPSATAPLFCPKCAARAWAQRYTAAYGPAGSLGTGIHTVATAHSPHTVMTTLRAVTSHAASGYCAERLIKVERMKSITVASISICLHAGRTPRHAACPGRCPHESTSEPARRAEIRPQAGLAA